MPLTLLKCVRWYSRNIPQTECSLSPEEQVEQINIQHAGETEL